MDRQVFKLDEVLGVARFVGSQCLRENVFVVSRSIRCREEMMSLDKFKSEILMPGSERDGEVLMTVCGA